MSSGRGCTTRRLPDGCRRHPFRPVCIWCGRYWPRRPTDPPCRPGCEHRPSPIRAGATARSSRCRWCRRRSRSTHVARRRAAGQEHVQPQRKRTGSISPRGRGGGAPSSRRRADASPRPVGAGCLGSAWWPGVASRQHRRWDAPAESFECDLTVANLGALVVDGDADNVAELCSNPFTKRRRHCRRVVQAEDGIDLGVRPVGVLTVRPPDATKRKSISPRVLANLRSRHGSARGARPRPRRAGTPESSIMGRLPVRHPLFLPLPGHTRADAGLRPPCHVNADVSPRCQSR